LRKLAIAVAFATIFSAHAWADQSVVNQANFGVAVTPSNTTILPLTKALFIGNSTACNIEVQFSPGSSTPVTFNDVQSGEILPFAVIGVLSTSTTCTGIVALY
jgi:hypothetical protein